MPEKKPAPLKAADLAWSCNPAELPFETTAELRDPDGIVGQSRAVEALEFAIGMPRAGFNVFALGPEGIGKRSAIRRFFDEAARSAPPPQDWCYVNDFEEPRKPRALALPTGAGAGFQSDMARFVDDLRASLRSAFESDEYRTRQQAAEEEFKEQREAAVAAIEERAEKRNLALLRTPVGFAFAPVKNGKPVAPEEFQALPDNERAEFERALEELQTELQESLERAPIWMQQAREKIRDLNRQTATLVAGRLLEALFTKYREMSGAVKFLKQVQKDIADNVEMVIAAAAKADTPVEDMADGNPLLRRYRVNLLVRNEAGASAPVVYEDDPSYDRMFGRVDYRSEMGALVTDLQLIRAGALHRANGGFLLLEARKVLMAPLVWEGLKRALVSGAVRIESAAQALGLLSTVTLEPEPIPLSVKIALTGDRMIYYLLSAYDPEFSRLFKVAADFSERFERDPESILLYARLLAAIVRRENLRPLDREAAARTLEQAARLAEDSGKLSGDMQRIADLLQEADYHAGRDKSAIIQAAHITRAIETATRRVDRIRERLHEETLHGTLLLSTAGEAVGQINGLSVLSIGGFSFGRPGRITARVRLGAGELVDIEREVQLGGPLHSKGVLILSGYLSSRYAPESPHALRATIVFEQSYGGVDGDSASSAELYALLSAISGVPLKQSLAVTGSVNQQGEIQAIGGVNEKIEGFFDLCEARGLDGSQGVLIPASNVRHLMLQERVRRAAAQNLFHIYPVQTIDEGLALLTGRAAGERGADGKFPFESINRLVEDRLLELAERARAGGRDVSGGPRGGSPP